MIQEGVPTLHNGRQVVMFTKNKTIRSIQGHQDLPSFYSWYEEDPNNNHLGVVSLWEQKTTRQSGIIDELLKTKSTLEVNGHDGKVTYELPVEEFKGCQTTKDMSFQVYPGVDGSTFKICLNKSFATGTVLTYDRQNGQQIIVTDEDAVELADGGYEHTVQLVGVDKATWFLPSNLQKGISYFDISHNIMGERGTNYYTLNFPDMVGTMKVEFQLGAATGVEASVTSMADAKRLGHASASSTQFLQKIQAEYQDNDMFIMADAIQNASGDRVPNWKTARIGSVLEWASLQELQRLTNSKLLWQKGGEIRDTNGHTRMNEGLWHQMKRGTIAKYAKRGGITLQHLLDAAAFIYRGNQFLDYTKRKMTFVCGREAFNNVLRLFEAQILAQNNRLGGLGLLGSERNIPNPIGNQNDPLNLSYGLLRFTTVFIDNLGWLTIKHDPSLDVMGMDEGVDRLHRGSNPDGLAPTTYSIMILDAGSQEYSNNKELPKGTKLVEGGNDKANTYIVKPEGAMTYWGHSNGRYSMYKSGDILSSYKQRGSEFWCWNVMDILMLDPSRVYMIELDDAAMNGFQ